MISVPETVHAGPPPERLGREGKSPSAAGRTPPRFSGHLHLEAARRTDGRTQLAAQSFRAPFHLSKPYWDPDAGVLVVQVVNSTAGILAGDELDLRIGVGSGAAALVTTPSASRVFRMEERSAECRQTYAIAAGGWLEVCPEPLVPHRGSHYRQETAIDLEPGAGLFLVEQLLPGRVAHGEAWEWSRLRLGLSVRVGGRLVLRERLDQSGEGLRDLAGLSGAGATASLANLILLEPSAAGSPPWLAPLRELHSPGLRCGVSTLCEGAWTIRLIAADPLRLREGVRAVRRILATSLPHLHGLIRKQ